MRNKPITQADADSLEQKDDVILDGESHADHALDEGLKESFPASDPVAVSVGKKTKKTVEKK